MYFAAKLFSWDLFNNIISTLEIMKNLSVLTALLSLSFAQAAPISYTKLTSVTSYRGDAVIGDPSSTGFVFKNMRFASRQTTLDDYVTGTFKLDLATQKLTPTKFEVLKGVGICEPVNDILLKDTPDPVSIYEASNSGVKYPEGTEYNLQSGFEYLMDLKVGQSVCMKFASVATNSSFRVVVSGPAGDNYNNVFSSFGSGMYLTLSHLSVLDAGTYKVKVSPASGSTVFGYKFSFANENFSVTQAVLSGNSLTASLSGASGVGVPYRKFKCSVVVGKTISLPLDADTEIILINSRGAVLAGPTNAGINYKATETGDCYIVIQPRDSNSDSVEYYSGVLSVQ